MHTIKKMFMLFLLLCTASVFAQSAPPSGRGAGKEDREANFAQNKQKLSSALSAASSCVASAADRKAAHECMEKLHASMPKRPGSPKGK